MSCPNSFISHVFKKISLNFCHVEFSDLKVVLNRATYRPVNYFLPPRHIYSLVTTLYPLKCMGIIQCCPIMKPSIVTCTFLYTVDLFFREHLPSISTVVSKVSIKGQSLF